jgi:hypothetical protein
MADATEFSPKTITIDNTTSNTRLRFSIFFLLGFCSPVSFPATHDFKKGADGIRMPLASVTF